MTVVLLYSLGLYMKICVQKTSFCTFRVDRMYVNQANIIFLIYSHKPGTSPSSTPNHCEALLYLQLQLSISNRCFNPTGRLLVDCDKWRTFQTFATLHCLFLRRKLVVKQANNLLRNVLSSDYLRRSRFSIASFTTTDELVDSIYRCKHR